MLEIFFRLILRIVLQQKMTSLLDHFDTYINFREKTRTPFSAFISNNDEDQYVLFLLRDF
jgi:hypothetical protein